VLYRNPVSATFSGLRRGYTPNILEQAKIAEDNFIYIRSQMNPGDKDAWRVLVFEEFMAEPQAFTTGWAEWWNLDEAVLCEDLANLRRPVQGTDIPGPVRELLEGFSATAG